MSHTNGNGTGSTVPDGRHSVTRPGSTRSMHAAAVVVRETGSFFANPAAAPRHAAPEWPVRDSDNRDMAVA